MKIKHIIFEWQRTKIKLNKSLVKFQHRNNTVNKIMMLPLNTVFKKIILPVIVTGSIMPGYIS